MRANDPRSPLRQGCYFWASGLFVFSCRPASAECVPPAPHLTRAFPPEASSIMSRPRPSRRGARSISMVQPRLRSTEPRSWPRPFLWLSARIRKGVGWPLGFRYGATGNVSCNEEGSRRARLRLGRAGQVHGMPSGQIRQHRLATASGGSDWKVVDGTTFRPTPASGARAPTRTGSVAADHRGTHRPESIARIGGGMAARCPRARVYQAARPTCPGIAPPAASLSPS